MRPHDAAFERERRRFRQAVDAIDAIDERPRRSGEPSFDRSRAEPSRPAMGVSFRNEPDTDFAQPENRRWIERALAAQLGQDAPLLGSLIAGERDVEGEQRTGEDPSRPGSAPYSFALASHQAVERALRCAATDPAGFSRTRPEERARLLMRIAGALRRARAELIALMVLDGGKRVTEADSEVSEAIDFAEYYRSSFLALQREQPVELVPRGTVLVTPPWNFPLAIPAGGVLAALMAGNRVILKPALETVWIAERMVRLFHAAGVPKPALQLVLCDDEVGSALVRDARVKNVVLTGATETARLFHRLRPGLHLLAETGGKNAYIVSAMSDRDQAIADLVQSAFGHAGQKCSAASLLILEAEVHDDAHFIATLADAVTSLPVGSAWDPSSVVTPLIRAPEGPLLRAIEQLEPGERWLVKPHIDPRNPRLVSPGVKLGVQPGSFTHLTELFGPILAVMRADSLDHAIALANGSGYGLTAGLASLDEREQASFVNRIHAGNVYVNRTTTGAIVERQPFGGFGKSGFGPGAKAGGPNYVAQLCHVGASPKRARRARMRRLPRELQRRLAAFARALPPRALELLTDYTRDYLQAHEEHFARPRDPQALLGQDNLFRYLPCQGVVLRVEPEATTLEVAASSVAASLSGVRLHISIHAGFRGPVDADLYGHPLRVEPLQALDAALQHAPRLRLLGTRTPEHDALCSRHGTHLADAPVLPVGRFELLHYLREQSVSVEYHRYGQLGLRTPERRRRK
jgi:RHH-type proline utilization regulon transcriptional repressor/proline dehydrogenase/delta 1-pyrroline-5-carboxylate dehydrogenase